jgi:hypothetical protein
MPELPDIQAYLTALEPRVLDRTLNAIRIGNPFLLRSVSPPVAAAEGKTVLELRRLGKRIVYAENEANYCAGCQTSGKIMAARMLSRLLKDDWPKRLEDLEK